MSYLYIETKTRRHRRAVQDVNQEHSWKFHLVPISHITDLFSHAIFGEDNDHMRHQVARNIVFDILHVHDGFQGNTFSNKHTHM